jgi:CheY-like chemotaxis protein
MGGQIGVQSNGKQGATFWFDVPLPIEHTADIQIPTNQRTNWNKSALNILLVDDNAVNLMVAKLMLTKCFPNCRVTEAVSGKAALEALARSEYDLVLMDVVMPDMDGPTATQTIRQLQRCRLFECSDHGDYCQHPPARPRPVFGSRHERCDSQAARC